MMLLSDVGRYRSHLGHFLEFVVIENLVAVVITTKLFVFLLKHVGLFDPQAQHVCVRGALRGLQELQNAEQELISR